MNTLKLLICKYHEKYKKFPSLKWLAEKYKTTVDKIEDALKKLIKEGIISRYKNTYYIKDDTIKKEINNTTLTFFIRWTMFFISIVAIFISIYYSAYWFASFLKYHWQAYTWAIAIVFYATFAPQAAIFLWRSRKITSFIMWITAILLILFSIISTVAGQYRSNINTKTIKIIKHEKDKLNLLKSEEKTFLQSLNNLQYELRITQNAISKFGKKDMKTYAYRIQFWKLYRLKKSRINYEKKIENIRIQIKKYLATKKIKHIIKKQSFYIWIASFLPFKASQIEFWLYMFPAIFVDIIAPLGMMIFLTMKGKQND